MTHIILPTVAGVITFGLLDYLWLAHVAKRFYLDRLAAHITIKDGALVPYLPAIPLIYGVAILGIWVFVLSWATTFKEAALYGALFGLLMYAFYDFTNLATLKDYPWSVALVDTVWGAFIVGAVSAVMFYVYSILA